MAERIKIVQGDTGPQIRCSLTDASTGEAIDLTGAQAFMHVRQVGEETLAFSLPLYINPEFASTGQAIAIFRPGDWDREAGEYEAELEVVNPSTGFRQTVFELMRFKLREDLG
ncbi:MAG: hypothetical protein EBV49_15805 [Betaproteobacteria bacterium]|jgi:hypothetical protein|nr:hypothetical protein [Betaproteobacteria bacterium]